MPLRLCLSVLITLSLNACGEPPPQQMPPAGVNVAPVEIRKVRLWDEFTGRIEAKQRVEIRPRVNGVLSAVHFREGSEVRRGQLLFSIDDREFRAALQSAEANLSRAQSRASLAQTELARSQRLIAQQAIAQGELEQRRGEAQQAQADVAAAQAQLTQAKLNLDFTRITSPISGRVSDAQLKPGNLLGAGSSLLTTVVSVDPMVVAFEGDERMYLRYQEMARKGERPSSRDARNPVRVGLSNEQGFPHEGEMVFVDNALDPGTGTIRARAEIPNGDRVFTPGLFARVRLLGSGEREVMLIHDLAVMTDQDRKYVYVVGKGEKDMPIAQRKDVVLGAEVDGLRVVEKGLEKGDQVVVFGVRKIFFPGAPLAPNTVPMDKPDQAPPAPAAPTADAASVGH